MCDANFILLITQRSVTINVNFSTIKTSLSVGIGDLLPQTDQGFYLRPRLRSLHQGLCPSHSTFTAILPRSPSMFATTLIMGSLRNALLEPSWFLLPIHMYPYLECLRECHHPQQYLRTVCCKAVGHHDCILAIAHAAAAP